MPERRPRIPADLANSIDAFRYEGENFEATVRRILDAYVSTFDPEPAREIKDEYVVQQFDDGLATMFLTRGGRSEDDVALIHVHDENFESSWFSLSRLHVRALRDACTELLGDRTAASASGELVIDG